MENRDKYVDYLSQIVFNLQHMDKFPLKSSKTVF